MTKFYLCTNIINPLTKKEETYYIINEELTSLLKYTSYCTSYKMLLNTLPNNNYARIKDFIKLNSKRMDSSFYYKKTKDSKAIEAIYKDDEDLLYTDSKSLISIMNDNSIFITKNEVYKNEIDFKIEEIYKFMASLITTKELLSVINYNFSKKFDSDRNLEYRYLEKCSLWQKIALVRENTNLVINYICKNDYKKFVFTRSLKKLFNLRLIDDKTLEKNKLLLKNKLKKKNLDYSSINSLMEKEFLKKFKNINSNDNNELDYKPYEKYDPYEDSNMEYEDMLYKYEKLLSENNNDDNLRLYVDLMKESKKRI